MDKYRVLSFFSLYLNRNLLFVVQPPRFDDREAADRVASPGVSVGLVWTSVGGEVQFVEATAMVGKGDLHLTGQLGDVIKESAQLALTWVWIFLCCHLSTFESKQDCLEL